MSTETAEQQMEMYVYDNSEDDPNPPLVGVALTDEETESLTAEELLKAIDKYGCMSIWKDFEGNYHLHDWDADKHTWIYEQFEKGKAPKTL